MKRKLKLLLATTLASVAVLSAAGVTLAVGVSDNSSTGSLSTANLKLSAKAENVMAYTAVPAAATDEDAFVVDGKAYKYEAGIKKSGASAVDFYHGGGSVGYDDKSVTVAGILPGDKVEFDVAVTSTSTIAFNYRAELYVNADAGETLLNQLDFSAGDLGIRRNQASDATAEGDLISAVMTDYTEWKTVGTGSDRNVEYVHVSISFPVGATEGADETVRFYYLAKGIQNTQEQPDVAEITVDGETKSFKKLADAVKEAEAHGVSEVRVVDGALLEEGAVRISHALRFVGVKKSDGTLPCIEGARISIEDGAGVSFEGVRFGGESYIDVSEATELVLKNCTADAKLVRVFDTAARAYLPEAAFIVSGVSPAPVKLTVTDCDFTLNGGAAIYLSSRLRNGSAFTGNTFGAEDAIYAGTAVTLCGADSDAAVRFEDNEIFAKLPLSLGKEKLGGRFTLVSKNNRAKGAESAFVGGVANAAFLDNGSEINGNALTVTQIASEGLLAGGADVALNDMNRVSSGKIVLGTATVSDFYFGFVAVETLANNAVVIYRGGTAYSYLNSNGDTFAETVING